MTASLARSRTVAQTPPGEPFCLGAISEKTCQPRPTWKCRKVRLPAAQPAVRSSEFLRVVALRLVVHHAEQKPPPRL